MTLDAARAQYASALVEHNAACAHLRALRQEGHRPIVYDQEYRDGWGIEVYVRVLWTGVLGVAYARKKRAWVLRQEALRALKEAEAQRATSRGKLPGRFPR